MKIPLPYTDLRPDSLILQTVTMLTQDTDDVLFFEDDAIASIAKRMVENPHYFAVSANSVNNPALSWIHYGLGVYEPYLPVSRSCQLTLDLN